MVNYGGSGGFQAWQFSVDAAAYGAKGDGVVCTLATTASSATVTASSPVFTSTAVDGGKHIMVHGALGATSIPLLTTISSVTDSTHAVLAAAPTATVAAAPAVFATDDAAAVNAAITAASAYAQAHDFFAEVIFGAKIYGLYGLTQASSPAVYNTQLLIPYPAQSGATEKLVIRLGGAGRADHCQYWESTVPNLAGTSLVSFRTCANSADPTFGFQSVIGGPSASTGFTGGFANTKLILDNLAVWCPVLTNLAAVDMTWLGGCHMDGCASHIFAPPVTGTAPTLSSLPSGTGGFTSTIGTGVLFPASGNNDDVVVPSLVVEGYELGFRTTDHFTGSRVAVIYSNAVISIDTGVGLTPNPHMVSIQQLSAESYNGGIRAIFAGYCQVDIWLDAENGGSAYDVYDNSNGLHGVVHWNDTALTRTPGVTGAANLKIISDQIGPGHMASPPAVPASAATAALVYRDAQVVVHTAAGVTVSAITVDGTVTGLTMAASSSLTVRVASGKTVALTYAGGTPTWDWWLD